MITVVFPIHIDKNAPDYERIRGITDIDARREYIKYLASLYLETGCSKPVITSSDDMPEVIE